MKIVFLGNGNRGVSCLQYLYNKGYDVSTVVGHLQKDNNWYSSVIDSAKGLGIETIEPEDPNSIETENFLRNKKPDLFILAGYGKILKQNIIEIPSIMCINLHAGKLPEYRGSSPLNWVLINNEKSFTLSIVKVDEGVDTGDIIYERTFNISIDDTIRELHTVANEQFPEMLVEVLRQIGEANYTLKPQDRLEGSYYPLRFPDDGLILWDMYTAEQIHNRIRALTEPYPCAYTYYKNFKVRLISSELSERNFFGEPGRVYQKSKGKLLVCANDKCLWISKAVFYNDGKSLFDCIERYEKLSTVGDTVIAKYKEKESL